MKGHSLLLLALLAGCEKDLLANIDASVDAPAMSDAATTCQAPATDAHAPAAYTVYLNFEGATLTKGADDSRTDHATVLINSQAVIPRYLPNESDAVRQGRIDLIVGYVQRAFAAYSIDVVTTRPTTGDYEMIVLGGVAADYGYQAGLVSIAPGVCDAMNRNHISLEFEVGYNATSQANTILSDLGAMVGLAPTTTDCDCMNRTVPCPTDNSLICTFATSAPAMTDANNSCHRLPTQDEPALLRDAWGCR